MGSTVGFFCGQDDNAALEGFAESIGLAVISPSVDKALPGDAAEGPYCFLSAAPERDLHPYGKPAVRLSDARDPLMRFMRGYFKNPYLVAGHIYWSNDVPALAAQTKPYYQRLSKWIKENWILLPGGGFYVGPQAKMLLDKGAEMANDLPDEATFSIVKI
jgi:hypothetical protein